MQSTILSSASGQISSGGLVRLSDADRDTLNDMLSRGVGENSLRATESDVRYLSAWSLAATGVTLPPAPSIDLVLKFVAHHFWSDDPERTEPDRGMPRDVLSALQHLGYFKNGKTHSLATIRRRMSTWRSVCVWSDRDHPFDDPRLRKVLRLAGRSRSDGRKRHSKNAITRDIVMRMIDVISDDCSENYDVLYDDKTARLKAYRDRAMIAFAFASGGRRRSEVANLKMSMIEDVREENGSDQSLRITLGRTKTTDDNDDASVYLTGRAAQWLANWIREAGIASGPVFRSIDRWGNISLRSITPETVNQITKSRIEQIGEDPSAFSAHGFRSGYLTTAALDGIPVRAAMAQSGHRSVDQAMAYFNETDRSRGPAARILDEPVDEKS